MSPDLPCAVEAAFQAEVCTLFTMLVTDLECDSEENATAHFARGLKISLRARSVALAQAQAELSRLNEGKGEAE